MSDFSASEKNGLAQRIDRFIKGLERSKRAPNRRESHHVVAALRCLHDGRYAVSYTHLTLPTNREV